MWVAISVPVILLAVLTLAGINKSADSAPSAIQQTMDRILAGNSVGVAEANGLTRDYGLRNREAEVWCKRHGITDPDAVNKKVIEIIGAFDSMQVKLQKPISADPLPVEASAPAK